MKYKRLTKSGGKYSSSVFSLDYSKYIYGYDIVETQNDGLAQQIIERLAELEDKIENGTMVELPCKVGDTLWYVNMYEPTPRIEENKVHTIEMFECMTGITTRIWTQNGVFYAEKMPNVFKTKAEAEAKLKKELEE